MDGLGVRGGISFKQCRNVRQCYRIFRVHGALKVTGEARPGLVESCGCAAPKAAETTMKMRVVQMSGLSMAVMACGLLGSIKLERNEDFSGSVNVVLGITPLRAFSFHLPWPVALVWFRRRWPLRFHLC